MHRITRRMAATLAVLALTASAAGAATGSMTSGVVHAHIDRSGTTVVSGYDGGAPLAPASK
jgi:hypothetical protein